MLELPSRFTRVYAVGNRSDVTLSDDYHPSADRRIAFDDTLKAIDADNRETLARDGNLRIGSVLVKSEVELQ